MASYVVFMDTVEEWASLQLGGDESPGSPLGLLCHHREGGNGGVFYSLVGVEVLALYSVFAGVVGSVVFSCAVLGWRRRVIV